MKKNKMPHQVLEGMYFKYSMPRSRSRLCNHRSFPPPLSRLHSYADKVIFYFVRKVGRTICFIDI